jgi:hypothetical protein
MILVIVHIFLHQKHLIVARSLTKMANLEHVIVEVLTAYHVVYFSKDLSLHHIILEGDALQVVKTLKDKGINCSRFGQLVEDTHTFLISLYWADQPCSPRG